MGPLTFLGCASEGSAPLLRDVTGVTAEMSPRSQKGRVQTWRDGKRFSEIWWDVKDTEGNRRGSYGKDGKGWGRRRKGVKGQTVGLQSERRQRGGVRQLSVREGQRSGSKHGWYNDMRRGMEKWQRVDAEQERKHLLIHMHNNCPRKSINSLTNGSMCLLSYCEKWWGYLSSGCKKADLHWGDKS